MISKILDLTDDFNFDSNVQIDVSGWDYVVAQFVGPDAAVTFKSTNDAGGVLGVYEGDEKTATNWSAIQGINLNNNTGATSTNASSTFKFNVVGKFLQFASTQSNEIDKLIVQLNKIS